MKNILESAEIFEAYATIDYCIYQLGDYQKKLAEPKSPIVEMIDESTGYNKKVNGTIRENSITLLRTIIKCKIKIDADYSADQKALEELLKLRDVELKEINETVEEYKKRGYKVKSCLK